MIKKIKIIALLFMVMFCVMPNFYLTVNAASSIKTISVHADIWTIHGTYIKSETSKNVYATNYSGYGEYEYCYAQCRSNISGEWAEYTSRHKLSKSNSRIALNLSNTIDKGKNISLRLIGGDAQIGDDSNHVKFEY